jgi:hypothetical protein
MPHRRACITIACFVALGACADGAEPRTVTAVTETAPPPVLVGPVTREQVLASQARWAQAMKTEPAVAFGTLPAGGEVIVYLGTWCGDSVREVTRLWRSLDQLPGPPPFGLTYIAVDRQKRSTTPLAVDLAYVPTFVVRREGREVGRVVESAPGGIAAALTDLLSGARNGVITGRSDL